MARPDFAYGALRLRVGDLDHATWKSYTLHRVASIPRSNSQVRACNSAVRFTLSRTDIISRAYQVRKVPCVDGSGLARETFTSQASSVLPCVRPVDAVHMTAGHNALRGIRSRSKARIRPCDGTRPPSACPEWRVSVREVPNRGRRSCRDQCAATENRPRYFGLFGDRGSPVNNSTILRFDPRTALAPR